LASISAAIASRPDLAFDDTSGTLTYTGDGNAFAPLTIQIAATDDSLIEGPEQFSLMINNGASGSSGAIVVDTTNFSVTTTIADTVGANGPQEQAVWTLGQNQTALEGDAASFEVDLTGGTLAAGEQASVVLTLTDIATDSSDYLNFVAAVISHSMTRPVC
jgi:hypothetical protein